MYAAACLAALVACSKEHEPVQKDEQLNGKETVLATAKDFVMAGFTKTSITQGGSDAPAFAWKAGDVIGIIPMNGKTIQSNYEIAEIGSNPKQAVFDGGVWALKEGKEYAAYYPFNEQIARSVDNLEFSFLGQTQSANNSLEHLGAYDYMYASAVVPQSGSAQFDFNHKISLVRLQLAVPTSDTYTKVVLESSVNWFANTASLKLSDGTMTATETVKSATINLNNIAITANGVLTIWLATLPTSALNGQTLSVKLFGSENIYTGEINGITALTAGNAYSYATVLSNSGYKSFTAMIASAESKSTFSPEGMLSWESGDAISVNGSECTTKTGGTTSVFSADTQVQPLGMVSPRFKAVFPASLETTPGKYVLPSVQPHSSTSVTVPMYAQSNDNNLTFNPMCGLLRVRFANATSITSVQITMDKAINGEFTIDADGTAVIKSGSTTTTLDCGSGAPATDKFYISIPAGTYNSLTLEAINEKGIQLSKSITRSLTIRRSTIADLGTLTFSD